MKEAVSSYPDRGAFLVRWRRLVGGIPPIGAALAALMILGILLLASISYRWLSTSDSLFLQFLVNGDSLLLSAEDGKALSRDLGERFAGLEAAAEKRLQPWMEGTLAEAREQYQAAGERYLDWYFSASGSYTRLGVGLVGDLEPWMSAQLEQRLVGPSGAEEALSNLHAEYRERLLEVERVLLAEALGDIYQLYSVASVPAAELENVAVVTLDLDHVMDAVSFEEGRKALHWPTPPLGAGLLSGAGITSALMARPAMGAAHGMVRRFVARLGLVATRSMVSGGSAAAAASPTGPGAVVAGTVTAGAVIAMTAGTEYIALVKQEEEHRPVMEEALVETWADLEAELRGAVAADRQASSEMLLQQVKRFSTQEVERAGLPESYRILSL